MGVYIKNMEMPKNCNECPLHFYEGQGICSCRALHAIDDSEILKPWKNKRKDCPLVPVPEHGRLKDADVLLKKCEFVCTDDDVDVRAVRYSVIDAAPTIIPVDESNMDSFIHIFEEDDEEDGMDSFIRILKD